MFLMMSTVERCIFLAMSLTIRALKADNITFAFMGLELSNNYISTVGYAEAATALALEDLWKFPRLRPNVTINFIQQPSNCNQKVNKIISNKRA